MEPAGFGNGMRFRGMVYDYTSHSGGPSLYFHQFRQRPAHSDDVDQSIRFDADQIGAKRRKALSV